METEDNLDFNQENIEVEEGPENSVISLREKVMAFLFVSLKPISVTELSKLAKATESEVLEVMECLISEFEALKMGIEIKIISESYQLRTKPEMSKVLQRLITPKMKRLSKAAAETLAVIAYKQPVAKAEIEAIRGVDALPTLKTLIDGKLIRIVGREDSPGSPALYGTTDFFLERFGIKDLSELPTVREVKELEDEFSEVEDGELENEDNFGSDSEEDENPQEPMNLADLNFEEIQIDEPESNINH